MTKIAPNYQQIDNEQGGYFENIPTFEVWILLYNLMKTAFTRFFVLMAFMIVSLSAHAQNCPAGQTRITVALTPDNYPGEISWMLQNQMGDTLMQRMIILKTLYKDISNP